MAARFRSVRRQAGWVLIAAMALASCSPAASGQVPSGPAGQCPTGTRSIIDRVDFVTLAGIQYEATMASTGRRLTDQDLGQPVGRVRCMLADLQFDPSYNEVQDGNAAFLPSGTVLFGVNGYASSFRLAARRNGQIVVYESDVNPMARRGHDLLDLAGRVAAISIDGDAPDGLHEIVAIRDAATVDQLVGLLLGAPVNQGSQAGHAGSRYFLIFHLKDGTDVLRGYFRDSGEVGRGILTPPEFRAAIEQAVTASVTTASTAQPRGICIGKMPKDWSDAFARASVILPTTQFLVNAASPWSGVAFGYFRSSSQQGIASLDLTTGALEVISTLPSQAAGVSWMSFAPPWLVWTQGDSQTDPGVWSIHAWNWKTRQKLDVATSALPVGTVTFGQIPRPVVGSGLIAWAQGTSRRGQSPPLAEVRVFRTDTHETTTVDSGQVTSPVLAGPYLVWGRIPSGQSEPVFEVRDPASLKPIRVSALSTPRPIVYLAGSDSYLVWSEDHTHLVALDLFLNRLTAFTYTADQNHSLQFLMTGGHFVLWYAGQSYSVVDLTTGNAVDLPGSAAIAGNQLVWASPIGQPATNGALTGTKVARLDLSGVDLTSCLSK